MWLSSNCLEQCNPTEVEQSILKMQDMKKSEQDIFILDLLESLKHSKESTTKGKKRTRERFTSSFHGVRVCAGDFRVLYNLRIKHFKKVLAHLEEFGLYLECMEIKVDYHPARCLFQM